MIESDETWLFDEEEELGSDELCVYDVEHDKDFVGNYYFTVEFKSWKENLGELALYNSGLVMINDFHQIEKAQFTQQGKRTFFAN